MSWFALTYIDQVFKGGQARDGFIVQVVELELNRKYITFFWINLKDSLINTENLKKFRICN